MKFRLTDGTGKISIGLCNIGSYFYFKKPLVTSWYDCRGSIGKYLCSLPYCEEYRNEVRNRITDELSTDFSGREENLREILVPFLKLLPSGEYDLNYYHGTHNSFFRYTDHTGKVVERYWCLIFSEPVRLEEKEKKIKEHEIFVHDREAKKQYAGNIVDFSTTGFYGDEGGNLLATQPESEINKERVAFFESEIRAGKRPAIILFNCAIQQENEWDHSDYTNRSDYYVLDGHHKLQAYSNLKITPSVIEITHLAKTYDEIEFNAEELVDALFPWQLEHLIENWSNRDTFLKKYLDNPNSKLHQVIRNGHYQDYYANGKIKHEACYINHRIEGEAKWWYDNGQLKQYQCFKKGYRTGTWKQWYKSGALEFIQPYNDKGQINGSMISYFENGQKRWEQTQENGICVDGYSYLTWYENGSKDAELKYKNGQMVERKNYDRNGNLVNFEEFDPVSRKMIKRK